MTEWLKMDTAPRDGRPVIVAVKGRDGFGWSWHELPFPVCFLGGRWCYARNRGPVFPWHAPLRWRQDEGLERAAA